MNFRVFQFVLVLVIKANAVLVNVAHDRRFPGRAP